MTLEIQSRGTYASRTRENAAVADLTIAFALTFNTAGERLTQRAAGERWLGIYLTLVMDAAVDAVVVKMKSLNAKHLNIAGNSIVTLGSKMSQETLDACVYTILRKVHAQSPIASIRSGGQTGVDEAGIKAGLALGIPCVALLPRGNLIRKVKGQDIRQTDAETRLRLTPKEDLLS